MAGAGAMGNIASISQFLNVGSTHSVNVSNVVDNLVDNSVKTTNITNTTNIYSMLTNFIYLVPVVILLQIELNRWGNTEDSAYTLSIGVIEMASRYSPYSHEGHR